MATMFQVQQVRYGKIVCLVGSPYKTRKEADDECSEGYRADWESSHQITPITQYVVVEVER